MVKPAVEDIRTRTKKKVIHQVITERSWKTEEYAKYLKEHEQTVLSLFGQELPESINENVPLAKHHNIRSLITALESFYRVYYHMTKAGTSWKVVFITTTTCQEVRWHHNSDCGRRR